MIKARLYADNRPIAALLFFARLNFLFYFASGSAEAFAETLLNAYFLSGVK